MASKGRASEKGGSAFEKRPATSTRGGAARQGPETWSQRGPIRLLRADPLRRKWAWPRGEIVENTPEVLAQENALCGEGEVRGWRVLDSWVLGRREAGHQRAGKLSLGGHQYLQILGKEEAGALDLWAWGKRGSRSRNPSLSKEGAGSQDSWV